MVDMRHMNYIDRIAEADANTLRRKEATYQGSWKRAGGRSAWFMMRRNMDRLIEMMKYHELDVPLDSVDLETGNISLPLGALQRTLRSEDIFAKIDEKPDGSDGTVLACLRDLRRYLLLIEAEMVSRGSVIIENAVDHKRQDQGVAYRKPEHDVYQLIADEKGLTRHEVKNKIYQSLYGVDAPASLDAERGRLEPSVENVTVELQSQGNITVGPGTPEDGGHHECRMPAILDAPWIIDAGQYGAIVDRVGVPMAGNFYSRRAANVYRLDPIVRSHELLRDLRDFYDFKEGKWILRLSKCPDYLRDEFPILQREMNRFEFDTSPDEYKMMYAAEDEGTKFRITKQFDAWGR